MSLDAAYTRRVTHVRAVQVTHANLAEVALWCGGSTWAASVRVPRDGSWDTYAVPGEWVVQIGPHFEGWTDEAFRAEFVPQMSIYQPVGERIEAGCRRRGRNAWCEAHGGLFLLGNRLCAEALHAHGIEAQR